MRRADLKVCSLKVHQSEIIWEMGDLTRLVSIQSVQFAYILRAWRVALGLVFLVSSAGLCRRQLIIFVAVPPYSCDVARSCCNASSLVACWYRRRQCMRICVVL
ncbi:hypothetical protein NPIL_496941 [Nephila pilipes]|uniref:Uncharacterized protein n=1 Tax=Nephila pilipes TaxID=299642 RepID=A0A8X6NPI2_NEPPI|nr:hypothetical protein NPIL_496941 [Nephila pilipes]